MITLFDRPVYCLEHTSNPYALVVLSTTWHGHRYTYKTENDMLTAFVNFCTEHPEMTVMCFALGNAAYDQYQRAKRPSVCSQNGLADGGTPNATC